VFGGRGAFAALLFDGSVVTWGFSLQGHDSRRVEGQLTDVKEIITNYRAMAALKYDGTVVTWGAWAAGANTYSVRDELHDVRKVEAMHNAMFAIKSDGTVVSWGLVGDVPELDGCEGFAGTNQNLAAISRSGCVVTWGDEYADCAPRRPLSLQLQDDVQAVASTQSAFAALKTDGSVVAWGTPESGGDSSSVQHRLQKVQSVTGNNHAFAAVLHDGCVVTWGEPDLGGDSSSVRRQLHDVQSISHTLEAFAALRTDDSVVTWGGISPVGSWNGAVWPPRGIASPIADQLQGEVTEILGNVSNFAALKTDGRVVEWGVPYAACRAFYLGVADQLQEVQAIAGSGGALAAVQTGGRVVTWGDKRMGGDSGTVQDQLQGYHGSIQPLRERQEVQ